MTFTGFAQPTANYSKLPHQLINELPQITTIGEMKVLLYVLRHTWGFQEFGEGKKITLDEFEHGRKRKDRTRMDNGTGLTKSTIIAGLKKAVEHGFLIVETDSSDKGRVKKSYALNMGLESKPVDVESLYIESIETTHRTEKETLRKKPKKNTLVLPSEGIPELTEYKQDDSLDIQFRCSNIHCDDIIVIADLDNTGACCPHCSVPVRVRNERGKVIKKPSWKVRQKEKGAPRPGFDDKPLKAFCAVYSIPYDALPPKKKKQWAHQIQKVAEENGADVDLTYQAIRGIKDSEHAWQSFKTPYSSGFQDLLALMILRLKSDMSAGGVQSTTIEQAIKGTGYTVEEMKGIIAWRKKQ